MPGLEERLARIRAGRSAPTVRMPPVTVEAGGSASTDDQQPSSSSSSPSWGDKLYHSLLETSQATTGPTPFGPLTPKGPDNKGVPIKDVGTAIAKGVTSESLNITKGLTRAAGAIASSRSPEEEMAGEDLPHSSQPFDVLAQRIDQARSRLSESDASTATGRMLEPVTDVAASLAPYFMVGPGAGLGLMGVEGAGADQGGGTGGLLARLAGKAGVPGAGAVERAYEGTGAGSTALRAATEPLIGEATGKVLEKGAELAQRLALNRLAASVNAPARESLDHAAEGGALRLNEDGTLAPAAPPMEQALARARAAVARRQSADAAERQPFLEGKSDEYPVQTRKLQKADVFTPENEARFQEAKASTVAPNEELRARIKAGEDLSDAEVHQAEPAAQTIYDVVDLPHPTKPETTIGAETKRARIRRPPYDASLPDSKEPVDVDQAIAQLEQVRSSKGGQEFGDQSDVIEGLKRDKEAGLPVNRARLQARIIKSVRDYGKAEAVKAGVTPRSDGEVVFLIGPPGSGKSTVANKIGKDLGAYVIDADPAKLRIPEYATKGANGTHEESSHIAATAADYAVRRGENIIIPTIGKSRDNLIRKMNDYKALGAKVHVVLSDLDAPESSIRAFNRGVSKGRDVPMEYVLNEVGNKPRATYEHLKNDADLIAGRYARLDQSHPPEVSLHERVTEKGPAVDYVGPERRGRGALGSRARRSLELRNQREAPAEAGRGGGGLPGADGVGEVPRDEPTPGQAPEEVAGKKLPGLDGDEDQVTIGDRRLKIRHRVVEAADLVPSNNPANGFERDARYPQTIQGRVYSGEAGKGARERVVEMAGKLEPAGLTLPSRSVHGAPIVTENGHSIVGNQRVMAWQMAGENPASAARMKAQVVRDAGKLGVDPAQVEAMHNPMVVRQIVDPSVSADDHEQLAKLNQLSDVATGKAKDPRVEAAGRARQMQRDPAALDYFATHISPDETINEFLRGRHGPDMLDRLVKSEVLQPQELDQFRDPSTNKLTKYGRERIQEMIQGAAVGGDPAVLDRAPESVLQKLDQAWPRAVKAEGTEGWSLEDPLKQALSYHGQRADNELASISDVVDQSDMFGRSGGADSKGVTLAKYIESHKKAEITEAFREYATAAEAAKKGVDASDMFGHKPETADDAFSRIFVEPAEPARPQLRRAGAIGNQRGELALTAKQVSPDAGGSAVLRFQTPKGEVAVTISSLDTKEPHVDFIGLGDRVDANGEVVHLPHRSMLTDENKLGPGLTREILRRTSRELGLEGKEISGMRVGGARAFDGDTESYAHFRMGPGRGRAGVMGSVAGDASQDPHNIAAAKMLSSIAGGGIGAAGGAALPGSPEEKKARAALGLVAGMAAPFAPEIVEQLAEKLRSVEGEVPAKIFRIRASAEDGVRATIQGRPDKEQLEKLLTLWNNHPGQKFGYSMRDLEGRDVGRGDSIVQLYGDLLHADSNKPINVGRSQMEGAIGNQPDMFGHVAPEPDQGDLLGQDAGKPAASTGVSFDKRQADASSRYDFLVKQLKRMPQGPARTKVAREVADLAKIANYDQKIGYDEGRARIAAGDELFSRSGAIGNQPAARKISQAAQSFTTPAIVDATREVFAPANRGAAGRTTGGIIRHATGDMARDMGKAQKSLEGFAKSFDELGAKSSYDFMDRMERGQPQPTPELSSAAAQMRKLLDTSRTQIQALGTGKLEHFIQDYFPHIWEDPDKAASAFAKVLGKRPLVGPASFLKQRSIPTIADGLALGLKPVSDNPVDLVMLKLHEMNRYLTGQRILSEMKDAGLVKFVRATEHAPDGYLPINDKIATVNGPLTEEGARTIRGTWAGQAEAAQVLNNYLSPGLRQSKVALVRHSYGALMGLSNMVNQAQLGLSAFHLGFTSLDAAVSKNALAVEQLMAGKPLKALASFAESPIAPVTTYFKGSKVLKEYYSPGSVGGVYSQVVDGLTKAGGRVSMDRIYKNNAIDKMTRLLREEGTSFTRPARAAALAIPTALEAASKPILEHLVPRQKLGVFFDLARHEIEKLGPYAPIEEVRHVLGKVWDSVDNRMGQMVYDNLFWNKAAKDLAMASVRSVGWNLGTIREVGGGAVDLARGRLSHKAAYAISLPITVGMAGAVTHYLYTGEAPSTLKDYFYPKTGRKNQDGDDERVQLPSYMKDVAAYSKHPWGTIKHKLNPVVATVADMLDNVDYYGDEIRNPDDPLVKQLMQEKDFIWKTVQPFGIQNAKEQAKRDQPTSVKVGSFVGITPAARDVVRSDAENKMAEYIKAGTPQGATPEEAEKRQLRGEVRRLVREKQPPSDDVIEAARSGELSKDEIRRTIKSARIPALVSNFKSLTLEQAIDVYRRGTPAEQAIWRKPLLAKYANSKARSR